MIQYNRDDEDSEDIEMSDDNSGTDLFKKKPSEILTDVFGFENNKSYDDEDDENEISRDDNFEIPDSRAWGKKKKTFYYSDYIDTDFATLNEKDEKNAKTEEEEAKIIQRRIAQELDDVDFCLNIASEEQKEFKDDTSHVIKIDMSKFSNRQKLDLLEKESPEFAILVQDFKDQMLEVKTILDPHLKLIRAQSNFNSAVFKFFQTKYQIALQYCINILFYLTLKSMRLFFNSHPVIKRLSQYRQLLNQMSSIQDQVLDNFDKMIQLSEKRKSLIQSENSALITSNTNFDKRKYLQGNIDEELIEENTDKVIEKLLVNTENMNDSDDNPERRSITYQMAKNKGLTPHRSKEQRNPRVKLRNKYRKAKIRRKGAVREVRKELQRYGGETSGIKIGVKKSITLK